MTVAALIEREGRFLMVEEETVDGVRINQPAGHLEDRESLVEACAREALEETAHHFTPEYLIGVYHWPRPSGDATYVRFTFGGSLAGFEEERALDTGILRAMWMTLEEIAACRERHRNEMVWSGIQDYLAGRRFPLELIRYYGHKGIHI